MIKIKSYKWVLFAVLSAILTFFCVVSGNFFTKKVSLQLGEIAKETLYAPFQVENEIATARKKQEAEAAVQPVYKKDSTVQEKAIGNIETFFDYIHTIQTTDLTEKLEKTPVEVLSGLSPIALYNEQYEALLGANSDTLNQMKNICMEVTSNLFNGGISPEESNKSIEVRMAVESQNLNSTMKKIAEDIMNHVLEPNVVIDEVATNEQKKLAQDKVDPVYVLAQEKIIEKGARVTEEVYRLLEKVGYLETNRSERYQQYIGVLALIILVSVLFYYYIYKVYLTKKEHITIRQKDKRLSLVFILFSLAMLMTRAFLGATFVYLPLSITCMMIAFAMEHQIAFMTQVLIVIFSAIIFKGDIIFILYFLISGIASTLIVTRMQERTRTLMSSLYVGGIQFVLYIALKLLVGSPLSVTVLSEGLVAFIMGMISVVAVIGALPMFEAIFEFVTPMQLLEMTNPNQPILKRLLLEATGTYYHSLLVANLAEAGAASIDANPLLARVGGYYHDIGKLTCSNYFKENQGSTNPHDYMTPKESYEIIVSHVTSGLKLAEEYHLPNYIKDFIMQHHGTGLMQYFYVKAQKESDEPISEKAFSYPGPRPQTKEAALVMLADVVEATTRAMQDKLGKEIQIEDVVRRSVKQKLEEGQLDECQLYISDMEKIIESFTKMLNGMYHQRIAYPERNEKK
ncbi:MAG: HDIG domain-containing protein [Cellulosilyticum sp.]|nr:HDIG domain-containing protein [Cellulosilyticum sp.]